MTAGVAGVVDQRATTGEGEQAKSVWVSSFLVALVLFALANLAFSWAPESAARRLTADVLNEDEDVRKYGKPCSWWLAKCFVEQQGAPDIVIFGSSQMGGLQASDARIMQKAVDFTDYHRSITVEDYLAKELKKTPIAFTCALPGAMASDHCLIARALFTEQTKPKLAIIGISPRDFMDNTLPAASATEPFQFYSRYIELGPIMELAYPDWYSRLDWMLTKRIPLRRLTPLPSKDNFDEPPAGESGNKQMAQTIVGAMGNVRRGQCMILPDMPQVFIDNTKEYKHRYRKTNPPGYKQQLAFFKEFLKNLRDNDIGVLVVGMPVMASNRALLPDAFWSSFRSTITADCQATGAQFVDLSDSDEFVKTDFVDTVHLNANGGNRLAAKMAEAVLANKQLAAALTNPSVAFGRNAVAR